MDDVLPGATRDPVCGRSVFPATAATEAHRTGRQYYFCSFDCARRFRDDPRRYEPAVEAGP